MISRAKANMRETVFRGKKGELGGSHSVRFLHYKRRFSFHTLIGRFQRLLVSTALSDKSSPFSSCSSSRQSSGTFIGPPALQVSKWCRSHCIPQWLLTCFLSALFPLWSKGEPISCFPQLSLRPPKGLAPTGNTKLYGISARRPWKGWFHHCRWFPFSILKTHAGLRVDILLSRRAHLSRPLSRQFVWGETESRASRPPNPSHLTRGQRVTTPNTTSLWPLCFPKGLGYIWTRKLIHSCWCRKGPDHTAVEVRRVVDLYGCVSSSTKIVERSPLKSKNCRSLRLRFILTAVHCLLLACYVCGIVMSAKNVLGRLDERCPDTIRSG